MRHDPVESYPMESEGLHQDGCDVGQVGDGIGFIVPQVLPLIQNDPVALKAGSFNGEQ